MGRQLRRVPIDFAHPIHETWPGYLNPHYTATKCEVCDGDGGSPIARQLKDAWYGHAPFKPEDRGSTPLTPTHPYVWAFAERNVDRSPDYYGLKRTKHIHVPLYRKSQWGGWRWDFKIETVEMTDEAFANLRMDMIFKEGERLSGMWNQQWCHHLNQMDVDALIDRGRLHDLTSTFTPGKGWQPKDPPYHPTAAEVNEWSLSFLGHDSINQWVVTGAFLDRHGLNGSCEHCAGEGVLWPSPEAKALYDGWEPSDPPRGEGYQMWETTTEGSPISPVFKTPEELARYLVSGVRNDTIDRDTSYDQWMSFIVGDGWALTMIAENGVIKTGVEASADRAMAAEPLLLTDQSC